MSTESNKMKRSGMSLYQYDDHDEERSDESWRMMYDVRARANGGWWMVDGVVALPQGNDVARECREA